MSDHAAALSQAIQAIDRLKALLAKSRSSQVRNVGERQAASAVAQAWFQAFRPQFNSFNDNSTLREIDGEFSSLLHASDRASSRAGYRSRLKAVRTAVLRFRSDVLDPLGTKQVGNEGIAAPPNFSNLTSDARMRQILERRWEETGKCMRAEAYLAATVMMGALLEALILARINRLSDKSPVFRQKSAPKDKKTGKTLPLSEWKLQSLIQVAFEMKWLGKPGRDVGSVMRDYRNFIHPEREYSSGITIHSEDANMFLAVFTSLAKSLVDVP